jgi:hypothetical protein
MTNVTSQFQEKPYADYDDVYILGDVIDSSRTELYNGVSTGYEVEVISENYSDRTMTIRITK